MSAILLLSRDSSVWKILREATSGEAYQAHRVLAAENVETFLDYLHSCETSLIVLDLASVGERAELLCRRMRNLPRAAQTALLCIVDGGASAVAQVLDAGADDCLRRATLNARELSARLRALLRRAQRAAKAPTLVIYTRERTIQLSGRVVELTPTEFQLLEVLSEQPGEYFTANELLERVWHYPSGSGDPALVRNHVRNLRLKLESDPERPRLLTSAHGRGYALSVDAERL
jgi:DNA-binding response OmpR family regulator